jgi:hypothetical protein
MLKRLLASGLKRLPRDPVVVGKILYGLCEMDARTHAFIIAAQDVKRPSRQGPSFVQNVRLC